MICTRTDCCLLLYLNVSTYEYYRCCWCCCTYRVVPYDPSLVVASFVASHSRTCCCWAESSNGYTVTGVFAFFAPFLSFLLVCCFFLLFRSLRCCTLGCTEQSVCIQLNSSTYTDCCCCCTSDHLRGLLLLSVPKLNDLQHSSSWLLLLSFIVNRLLIVYQVSRCVAPLS